ncbi:MAG: hypothetical protein ACM3ML_33610 [Micromonosporaceae bacterium]
MTALRHHMGDGAAPGTGGDAAPAATPLRRAEADALAPLRAAVLRAAVEEASQVRGAATAEAEAVLAAARDQAAAIASRARALGASDGKLAAAAHRAQSRRSVRALLLGAECDAYEELRRQVRSAVCGLRDDPCYPRLLARLTELARAAAGPDAVVSAHPAGGVTASAPGKFVDCSLPRIAEIALGGLGAEVSTLWSQ